MGIEWRFPYLLLWNFSDGTGWKILRGAWNAWHKNSGYRGVCFLSVYLFSVMRWICLWTRLTSIRYWNKSGRYIGHLLFSSFDNYACILKAHSRSHSMSGGSIWASLECQCCFWIAGWLLSYTLLCDYSLSSYSKTALTLKGSSNWTSTLWVWACF
jgi:hypothetical protein